MEVKKGEFTLNGIKQIGLNLQLVYMQVELHVWFSLWDPDQFSFISMAPMSYSTTKSSKMYFKRNKDNYNCVVRRLEIYYTEFC